MSETDKPEKPKPVRYYLKLIQKGNGQQWQKLFEECRKDYDVAFAVAQAVSQLGPEFSTMQQMWKNSIEYLQPGISIKLGNSNEEDFGIRSLKKQKYSE